eukprot:scaffold4880_cov173-Skeletonema_dohrnii-CCMP3373.AAC.10
MTCQKRLLEMLHTNPEKERLTTSNRQGTISVVDISALLWMQYGHRRNYAAVKDARIMSLKEEYALGMEQRSSDAAAKGVQIKPIKEESALSMEQN